MVDMKKRDLKKFHENKFFFSFLLTFFTSKSHLKVILEVKNARSRHEFDIGGCIGTIWSEESCSYPQQTTAKISRNLSLNRGLGFLLVNFHKFENCLKTVMFGQAYLPPKGIYHQKIAS